MTQEAKHTEGEWRVVLSDNATPHIMYGEGYEAQDKEYLALPQLQST